MTLNVSYVTNGAGQRTAVQLPYNEWEKLMEDFQKIAHYTKIKSDLTEAKNEIAEVEAGKLPSRTLKQFLDEL